MSDCVNCEILRNRITGLEDKLTVQKRRLDLEPPAQDRVWTFLMHKNAWAQMAVALRPFAGDKAAAAAKSAMLLAGKWLGVEADKEPRRD